MHAEMVDSHGFEVTVCDDPDDDMFISCALAALVDPVKTHFLWRPMLRDPNDEMVLEAAVNGMAEAIVTFNLRDFGTAPSRFNIELMTPSTAIRRVRDE